METRSKPIKTDCLRKAMKPGSKLRLKLFRVSTEGDEALKQCRASAVRATLRKYLHREQRRTQLARLHKVLGDIGKKEKRQFAHKAKEKKQALDEKSPAAACVHRQPSGAMAPENTTQYLMGNVYEDMKANIQTAPVSHETSNVTHLYNDYLLPSVYAAVESDYDSCLAFQQRDFEEAFDLFCGALDGARPVGSAPEPLRGAVQRNESNAPPLSPGHGRPCPDTWLCCERSRRPRSRHVTGI
ncbi:hypothetical protein FQN60_005730, partial [Etheostoma spectabile]